MVKKYIPNTVTAFNLFFGCLSLISAIEGNLEQAALYIVIGAILDFFDGFLARALNVKSDYGKELDSLADIVTFGVAPGMIFYMIVQDYLVFDISFFQFVPLIIAISYFPMLIPMFSAFRLAKFNNDESQSDKFIGLPTPANALLIAAIPYAITQSDLALSIFTHQWFLILFPLVSAFLLVSKIPMLAFKFNNFAWKGNEFKFLTLIVGVASLLVFKFAGVGFCVLAYILFSLINNIIVKNHEV